MAVVQNLPAPAVSLLMPQTEDTQTDCTKMQLTPSVGGRPQ